MNVINYIIFILFFLIMYSVCFKTVEGFDDDFYYYDKLIDYKTIPPSFVNDATPSKTVNKFGFYKGKGTFKKGYTKETKSDEKISTLNKLLDRLLGRIVSDNQDCVGSFGKYSECDKSCGSNAFQTRKYNITQQRGKNGKDCPFVDGYEEKLRCNLDECQMGDICENNSDCETGNCNPDSTRCENMVPCDSDNFHICNENQCINLNNDNDKMIEGSYIYNTVDKECFFKTPAEIEELDLNIYTYDFDQIRDKLKDIVLDCEYYQVEKEEGIGPCVNRPNVIIDDSGEPKCSDGFAPEPTMFNASYACSKCILKDRNNNPLSKDECYCPSNTKISESGTCERSDGEDTNNLCSEILKVNNGGCNYCNDGYSFKKEGNTASCIQCPTNQQTLREFCFGNCNPSSRTEYNEFCTQYCDGISDDLIRDDAILSFLDPIPYSNTPVSDLEGDYKERCINFSMDTAKLTICNPESSTVLNEFCYCNGSGENGEPTTEADCSLNCREGFMWNDATGQCVACPKLPDSICISSNENVQCVSLNREIYNIINNSNTLETTPPITSYDDNDPPEVQYCSRVMPGSGNNYYINDGEVAKCHTEISNGVCNECQSGTYQDGDGNCQNCPAGKFNSGYNCTNGEENCCDDCPDGSVSDAGSSSCRECDKGHYSSPDKTQCVQCEAGHYQNQHGQTSCLECPAGTYQVHQGREYCLVKGECWYGEGKLYDGTINQGDPKIDSVCALDEKFALCEADNQYGGAYCTYRWDGYIPSDRCGTYNDGGLWNNYHCSSPSDVCDDCTNCGNKWSRDKVSTKRYPNYLNGYNMLRLQTPVNVHYNDRSGPDNQCWAYLKCENSANICYRDHLMNSNINEPSQSIKDIQKWWDNNYNHNRIVTHQDYNNLPSNWEADSNIRGRANRMSSEVF